MDAGCGTLFLSGHSHGIPSRALELSSKNIEIARYLGRPERAPHFISSDALP